MTSPVGQHILADFWRCADLAPAEWNELIHAAVEAAGATLVDFRRRDFEPTGFTAVALLSESHLAVHTWPERAYVAIDLFTCGSNVDPHAAIAVLEARLEPARKTVRCVDRGRSEQPAGETVAKGGGAS